MEELIGKIAISKAGRDKGRYFVILSRVDDYNVLIVDGRLRKLDKPKKKKIKHLQLTNIVFDEFTKLDLAQEKNNSVIRNFLKSIPLK